MIDHDFELEKHYHPENFQTDAEEEESIRLADEEEKERKMTERMDRIEDQKFRWGEPKQQNENN